MQSNLFKKFRGYIESATFILSCFLALSYLGTFHFVFELLTHFTFHYAFFYFLSVVFFGICKDKIWFSVSTIGFILCILEVAPIYKESKQAPLPHKVNVFVANVNTANDQYDAVIDQIKSKNAQVVGLIEVSKKWLRKIQEIEKNYPYNYKHPRDDNFGLALYSKYPIEQPLVVNFGNSQAPSIVAIVKTTPAIQFVLTHTLPPLNTDYSNRRNNHLKGLAQASSTKERLIIGGDFNITPYSADYKSFLVESKLKNSRQGFGVLPSWGPMFLTIPIDHFFTSQDVNTHQMEVLSANGSDHLPIYAEFSYR
ncbi:MAG: endonuclease/exonuclease/phosphatase family protein [Candidatus Cloacimonetes bacterium]|nr:endonuclease/exonuclease/phosphatase family protein [Candidatus Cloacimonadota bacterium]